MSPYEHIPTPKNVSKTQPAHRSVIIEHGNNNRYSDWELTVY